MELEKLRETLEKGRKEIEGEKEQLKLEWGQLIEEKGKLVKTKQQQKLIYQPSTKPRTSTSMDSLKNENCVYLYTTRQTLFYLRRSSENDPGIDDDTLVGTPEVTYAPQVYEKGTGRQENVGNRQPRSNSIFLDIAVNDCQMTSKTLS
ncbi:hypothetical protein TWF696_005959 [Orbilia brochopaga]|uniref:Uncharacterized protein n=1 Tax=Orbilia brochopaga TaxID=3140254 RepID=A0AAV9UUP7_9PEZI